MITPNEPTPIPKPKTKKMLNQIGLNRILWILVSKVGGTFTISEREIKSLDNVELKVGYEASGDKFIFIATKKQGIIKTPERIFVP